jgi:CheY-like chemotaxis protein
VAHSGPSALEEARGHRPDVVILDIGLPGMDGYQVARALRDDGFDRTVIVAVSGYGEESAQLRSRDAGFNHHLVKPVDLDALVALIRPAP